jgi:hypothetical protein
MRLLVKHTWESKDIHVKDVISEEMEIHLGLINIESNQNLGT